MPLVLDQSALGSDKGRDEFPKRVKDTVASRMGFHCSRCDATTAGPKSEPSSAVNVGVAAHISAAAAGGPRYNELLSPAERASIKNAIWMCQTCAKLIDSDPVRFTEGVLMRMKRDAELKAKRRLGKPPAHPDHGPNDREIIRFFVQCFDRPAFHDVIYQERSMEAFTTSSYRPLARIVLENTMPTTFWGHDPDLTRRPLSKSGATFSISVLPRNDAETDAWHGDAGGGRWRGSIQCSGDVDVTRLGPRPSRASRNRPHARAASKMPTGQPLP